MSELAVVPAWVTADHRQVRELFFLSYALATEVDSVHGRGQLAAVDWVTGGRVAPMTQRNDRVSWELVRAESWVALCVAANNGEPPPSDWAVLGVERRPWVAGDADFAHGTWRTLAWLLGVRPDPPIDLPRRDENGELEPGGERYATRPDPSSSYWREADQRRRQRNRAEAQQWLRHVRSRIEHAQVTAPPPG